MRALSGIQATGNITLGNYLGALQRWASTQDKYEENFYFVPDLHTLTVRQDPKELEAATYSTVAWLLAVGVDPLKSTIFLQSQVPAHSELSWILTNYVTMGELSRMTQYKEKALKRKDNGQIVGLFVYPALMAADILLYDADVVPVGDDQIQHIELTRDIASRFNKIHGNSFRLPRADVNKQTARIMNLQDPSKKMSKSDNSTSLGVVRLLDSPEQIRKKISKAVTDSGVEIEASASKPALTNLINIFAALTESTADEVVRRFKGRGYGEFKQDLSETIINVLTPLQENYRQKLENHTQIRSVLADGRDKARQITNSKMKSIKRKIGLITALE